MAATVDIHLQHGIISKDQVLLQDIYMVIKNGVHLMLSHHVIITLLENMDHAELVNQLQNALNNVQMVQHILKIYGMLKLLIQFQAPFKKFKHKS